MEDRAIVDLYWARNETAITETANKYERYLMKIAWNILTNHEDSEESVNDTYLHAWNAMPPHRPDILSTFLGKITRQCSIDIYRKKHAAKRGGSEYAVSLDELGDSISGDTEPEKEFEAKELAHAIEGFLRELPEEVRHLFIARYYHMDPLKDVAEMRGLSEANAKTILFRTRQKLKEYLGKEGYAV